MVEDLHLHQRQWGQFFFFFRPPFYNSVVTTNDQQGGIFLQPLQYQAEARNFSSNEFSSFYEASRSECSSLSQSSTYHYSLSEDEIKTVFGIPESSLVILTILDLHEARRRRKIQEDKAWQQYDDHQESAMYFLYDDWKAILKIQKFRRVVSYTGFYCFVSALSYWYTNNTTRAGTSRGDQFYASFPAGTELLTDTAKLYKTALGNCFEIEEWGPIEYSIMAKHFDRQGKPPYAYHSQYMAHLLSHGQLDGSGA